LPLAKRRGGGSRVREQEPAGKSARVGYTIRMYSLRWNGLSVSRLLYLRFDGAGCVCLQSAWIEKYRGARHTGLIAWPSAIYGASERERDSALRLIDRVIKIRTIMRARARNIDDVSGDARKVESGESEKNSASERRDARGIAFRVIPGLARANVAGGTSAGRGMRKGISGQATSERASER